MKVSELKGQQVVDLRDGNWTDEAVDKCKKLIQEAATQATILPKNYIPKRKLWSPRWVPFAGQTYYVPCPDYSVMVRSYKWTSNADPQDRDYLQKGLVFKSFEDAEYAALRMIELAKILD